MKTRFMTLAALFAVLAIGVAACGDPTSSTSDSTSGRRFRRDSN